MTVSTFEKAIGKKLLIPGTANKVRNECACVLGNDIGVYNTCLHLCRYCYANNNPAQVMENHAKHDPNSPFLIGNSEPGDIIHQAKQTSWIDEQLSFDFI